MKTIVKDNEGREIHESALFCERTSKAAPITTNFESNMDTGNTKNSANSEESGSASTDGSACFVDLPEDGPQPIIPHDFYDPVFEYYAKFKTPKDSICYGHWQWGKRLLGFRGRRLGVMLTPAWADALEYEG